MIEVCVIRVRFTKSATKFDALVNSRSMHDQRKRSDIVRVTLCDI